MVGDARRIRGFDGLRAIAVTLVFLTHRTTSLDLGGMGVILFFVLSGYLITGILLRQREAVEEAAATGWVEVRRFFVNRAFRIFPAYYAMLAILLCTIPFFGGRLITPEYVPLYLSYTLNLANSYVFHGWKPGLLLGHLWSLAVEEQFYLLSAPAFILAPRRRAPWIIGATLLLALIAGVVRCLVGANSTMVGTDPFVCFGTLALGCALAGCNIGPVDGRRSWGVGAWLGIMVAGPLLLRALAPATLHTGWGGLAVRYSAGAGALLTVRAVLLNQAALATRFLEWTPVRLLGRVSYAFYLWHLVIDLGGYTLWLRVQLAAWHVPHAFSLGSATIVPAEFLATLAIATASWWLIERPILRLRDRRRNASAPATLVADAT
jgi:peptidoglycan/LPS O-acetylase OafA/YrhL